MFGRTRFRFSVEKYERMVECGVLTKRDRVELIDGEIVDKTTISDRHAACVTFLTEWCYNTLAARATIRVQNPISLATSVPEPDLAVAKPRSDFYRTGKPQPADLLLVIEVADETEAYDRKVKSPLYAAARIAEYWVVDLPNAAVWVHRGPKADGTWTTVDAMRSGETLAPVAFPDAALIVAELLA
jgi:Uma2 family endonuclease